jgi:fructoselysine 6-kinase
MAITTHAISIGDNCIDHYLPPIERDFVGGNALNVAVAMQRAGLPSAYIGAVGNDEQGKLIFQKLEEQGVDVSYIQVLPGKTNQTDIQLTPSGDRIFVHEWINPVMSLDLDDATKGFISHHLLVHNTWLGGTEQHLDKFKQDFPLVSLDYGERYSKEFFEKTISYVDLAFFSLPESEAARAHDMAIETALLGPRLVVITMGLKGSLAYNGTIYQQPAIPVDVIDTLGAGDTFIGVFLANWLKNHPLPFCLLAATQAASKTCTHYGAWEYS